MNFHENEKQLGWNFLNSQKVYTEIQQEWNKIDIGTN